MIWKVEYRTKKLLSTLQLNRVTKQIRVLFCIKISGIMRTFPWNTMALYPRAWKDCSNSNVIWSSIFVVTKWENITLLMSQITWDEKLMTNKQYFEALDRPLLDFISQTNPSKHNTIWWKSSSVWKGHTYKYCTLTHRKCKGNKFFHNN